MGFRGASREFQEDLAVVSGAFRGFRRAFGNVLEGFRDVSKVFREYSWAFQGVSASSYRGASGDFINFRDSECFKGFHKGFLEEFQCVSWRLSILQKMFRMSQEIPRNFKGYPKWRTCTWCIFTEELPGNFMAFEELSRGFQVSALKL